MNYLFIKQEELIDPGSLDLPFELAAVLSGCRAQEALRDHNLKKGLSLSCVLENSGRGKLVVEELAEDRIDLRVRIEQPLPARMPVDLVVAYCRPQTIKKILHLASSLGLKSLSFVKTANVVPSYLQSRSLDESEIVRHLMLGCEQAGDGAFPLINHFRTFREFSGSDLLRDSSKQKIFGDIGNKITKLPENCAECLLFLGPESGFTPEEKEALIATGFASVSLGPRVLRLEVATAVLLGKLNSVI